MDNYSTFGYNRVTAIMSLMICQRHKKQEKERPWEREESQIWTLPSSSCDTGNWSASTDTCMHTRRLIIYEQGHLDAPARPWLRAKSIKLRGREQNRDSLCTGRWESREMLDKGISNTEKHKMETSATWNFSVWLFVFFLSKEKCSLALLRTRLETFLKAITMVTHS